MYRQPKGLPIEHSASCADHDYESLQTSAGTKSCYCNTLRVFLPSLRFT